jgi:hypothetical protein
MYMHTSVCIYFSRIYDKCISAYISTCVDTQTIKFSGQSNCEGNVFDIGLEVLIAVVMKVVIVFDISL